ncbi:MAG TPA: hypothetical protein VGL14_09855 [Methylomirabilota bacterium]
MRAVSLAGGVVVVGFGLLVVVLLVRSLPWPLIQDAPVMHYIAWRIGEGDVPYRDLYDINQPGVYVLHLALLRTLGAGDGAWRAFDLGWLAATAAAVAWLAARWGAISAAGAGLGFTAYHLAGGAWQAGQRDFLLCVFLVAGALGVARWLEMRGGAWSLAGAGLALGAAVGVKPYAVLFAGALGVLVLVAAARRCGAGGTLRALGVYVAGAAAVPTALGLWLALAGALRAWADIVFGYALPVYGHLGRAAPWFGYRWPGWIPFGVAVIAVLVAAAASRRLDARHLVAAVGVVYGVVHYVGQAKGSEYHLYPLAAFVCVLAFAALTPTLSARRAWLGVGTALMLAVVLVLLAAKGLEASDAPWIWDKERRVRVLVDDLRGGLAPGDTVQVLDVADGGLHALLRLHVAQPTRFVYDVFFFHEAERPVVRALRAEFIAALEARPPRFIVLMRGWPSGDYDRIRYFPALAELLARRYDVVVTREGHRLYAKRAGA